MLVSKLQKAASLLYTLSCRHESWVTTAKHLIDDVPVLLKSENLHGVSDVLSVTLKSLLANAVDFIKWVAEVRRQEENESGLSKEEKGRLSLKEEVLQQVRETELFKYVMDWVYSARSCCQNGPSSSDTDSLSEIAANVCHQGALLLSGDLTDNKRFCCRATRVKCLKANGDDPITVFSGRVVSGGNEQGFDMLVPVSPSKSRCCSSGPSNCPVHSGSNDIFTVLLLALPDNIWVGIKDEALLAEIHGLVSKERLPQILQEEVLHLRRQLHFLRCKYIGDDLLLSSCPWCFAVCLPINGNVCSIHC